MTPNAVMPNARISSLWPALLAAVNEAIVEDASSDSGRGVRN